MRTMKLKDIIITEAFANTIPKKTKIDECRDYWLKTGKQDRYIVVNKDNVLIDGYIQYLVLEEFGIEEAEIQIAKKRNLYWRRKHKSDWDMPKYRRETTTYVYGKHPNSKDLSEYIWRIPKRLEWISENVQIGDMLLCDTKYGISPVIVTRIEVTEKCPVSHPVKKVARGWIKRGGMVIKH